MVVWRRDYKEKGDEYIGYISWKKKARAAFADLKANPKSLTAEVCDQVFAQGGPTFRASRNGLVCNQTGQWMKRKQAQSYALRVFNGTTRRRAFNAGATKSQVEEVVEWRPTPAAAAETKTLLWNGANGWMKCPHCHRDRYVTAEGQFTCPYCYKPIRIVRSGGVTASKTTDERLPQVTRPVFGVHVRCPLCSCLTWIGNSRGRATCDNCQKDFEVI